MTFWLFLLKWSFGHMVKNEGHSAIRGYAGLVCFCSFEIVSSKINLGLFFWKDKTINWKHKQLQLEFKLWIVKELRLSICEECHYEYTLHHDKSFREWEGCWGSADTLSRLGIQAEGRVRLLINKMMNNNQVNVVGEGIVGRAAFTGNHLWFLVNDHIGDAHPPGVQNEVHLQFLAGMQTVAVIPILPHGVVQLGSSLAIAENIGFVNYVKSLIVQLGCVPGALQPDSEAKESTNGPGVPVSNGMLASADSSGTFKVTSSTPLAVDGYNQQSSSSQPSRLAW